MIQIYYRNSTNRTGHYQREWQLLECGPFPITVEDFDKVRKEELELQDEYAKTHPLEINHPDRGSVAKRLEKRWPHLSTFDNLMISIWVVGKHVRAEKHISETNLETLS